MCAVDPNHPASIHELVSATESTTCYTEVAPGQECGFTVLMRTPSRAGKTISYWRLTGPTGYKFGHRLWCDVTVEETSVTAQKGSVDDVKEIAPEHSDEEVKEVVEEVKQEVKEEVEDEVKEEEKSQMIFPKLEKESPATSIHEAAPAIADPTEIDDFEQVQEHDDLEDDETEDGFLTDEEYDVLDASDEEYLAEHEKASKN